jgi:hypothetical protein
VSLSLKADTRARERTVYGPRWSVQQPVIPKKRTFSVVVTFAIANDGDSTANPDVRSSHLFINEVEIEGMGVHLVQPKSSFDVALPKQSLLFTYALEDYFKEPGVYTVRWAGDNFKAPCRLQ